jgi:hypothetical protein
MSQILCPSKYVIAHLTLLLIHLIILALVTILQWFRNTPNNVSHPLKNQGFLNCNVPHPSRNQSLNCNVPCPLKKELSQYIEGHRMAWQGEISNNSYVQAVILIIEIMPEHSQILIEVRCRCSGGCRQAPV